MSNNIKQEKIVNEILNDIFWLGYILSLKRKTSDLYKKEILGIFLTFYSSIFANEVIKSNFGGLSGKRKISKEEIEKFRTFNLKYYYSEESILTQQIINEMGIDFNSYRFDIVLIMNGNKFLDCNFRNWNLGKEENFELIDGIIASPIKWVEILLPEIYEQIMVKQNNLVKVHLNRINELDIKKKSYSVFKLFKNSKISNNEKIYVLEKIGLINNTLLLDDILKETITFNIGKYKFNSEIFMIKAKAIIIEMFGNERKRNNLIIKQFCNLNENTIDEEFYSLNRKCRNNLHYNDYHLLSEEQLNIVKSNQKIYLDNALLIFNKEIKYKFNFNYYFWLFLAKKLKE